MLLSECRSGQIVKVKNVVSEPSLRRRLFELGFLKDSCIQVLDVSPFRYAFLLKINDSVFALRQQIAQKIVVEELNMDENKLIFSVDCGNI